MSDITLQSMTNIEPTDWLGQARRQISRWRRLARQRRQLAAFSLRELQDIGITPADAWREIHKPFWRD